MTRFLLVANYQEYNLSTVSDAMGPCSLSALTD